MKYYVESYGCTMNHGEGRELAETMSELGFESGTSAQEADVVVLNTCTVVETTEKHMIARISELRSQEKKVIVTGCMAKAQPGRISIRLPDSPIISPENYSSFRDIVSERYGIQGCPTSVEFSSDAILPIAQGCLGNCSYCITKLARGNLHSYDMGSLLNKFNTQVERGSKEILITAQDTASYGRDIGTDLPALLRSMLETKGDYRLRIGMSDPESVKRVHEGIEEQMDDTRLYRFLHIPVQSGSNDILKAMRRKYSVEMFLELVDDIRAAVKDVSIATDIICGFPGESEEDHEKTMQLIRTLKADTVNITRFSPRPGTDAARMTQIHGRISSKRSSELTSLKNETELQNNEAMIGKRFESLATEKGKDATIFRTGNYRPVIIKNDVKLGSFAEIEVTEAKPTYLIGRIINMF